MMECRIGKELRIITDTPLACLPADEALASDQFIKLTNKTVLSASKTLATCNKTVENAVFDVVEVRTRILALLQFSVIFHLNFL